MAEEEIRARLRLRGRPEVQAELRKLERQLDRAGTAAMRSSRQANTFGSSWGFVGSMVSSAAQTVKYAAFGIVGAVTSIGIAAAGMGVQAYMGYEQAELAFTNLLKSGPKATQLLKDLQYLADHSPFELPGLLRGTQKLLAFGFAGEDIIPIMKRIGDASAGLAVGEEGIQRITLALGQMRTAGRVNAADIRQMSEVGIDVWSTLAKNMNTTIPKVRQMVTEGKVSSKVGLRSAFEAMDKFRGMTETQAKTMGGLWSTIKDGARTTTRQAIEPFADAIKGAMRNTISWMESIPKRVKAFAASAKTIGKSLVAGFQDGGIRGAIEQIGIMTNSGNRLVTIYNFLATAAGKVWAIFMNLATFTKASLVRAFAGLIYAVDRVINPLGILRAVTGFMARNQRIMIPLIWALVTAYTAWKIINLANWALMKKKHIMDQLEIISTGRKIARKKAEIIVERISHMWKRKHMALDGLRLRIMYLQDMWTNRITLKTKLWAAAQWLLNAAMNANPVFLIITAVGLLAVGIYTLYRRSERFRKIVQAVWGWIKKNWPLLGAVLLGPFGLLVYGVVKHWDTIKNTFKSVVNWVIDRWNGLRFKAPTINFDINGPLPGGKVKIGGWEVGVPRVNRLHGGGTTTSPGLVNWRPSEEVAFMPAGASVVPLKSDIRPLSETGGGYMGPERVVLEVDGKVLTEVVLGGVRKKVART